ncbi:anti-anti-sigma regulatory factor [Actinoplanes lutulentus]|uniref:STAS domain-containing protein n=1 Tax=Actinoplanes lutulentus TaxID=1287878 RepID=A0A327ZD92_9ACTN|nr:MEDS domain-containing protein [Actinoplanes lutulentus]MBB2942531.1 anti-anti-sigma regulatory factor [Actinoplanes lutulentus]RAK38112.1 STAS domain-containing protein [Actinoplanes lutulentus]
MSGLLERLSPGDHACLVAGDEPSLTRSVAAYVRAGLRARHRVVYLGHGEQVAAELSAQGVDVRSARAAGRLQITPAAGEYVHGGGFDVDGTVDHWRGEAERARAEGFHGFRAFGDMSWAARTGRAAFMPLYEARVNRLFAEGFAMGVCLYDRRLFGVAEMRDIIRAHPCTITAETNPDAVPLLRAVRIVTPVGLGVRLEGEADLSNRDALRTVLDHLAEEPGAVLTLDVAGLRFADSAAARTMLRATGSGRRLRIVGCLPALRRMLLLHGAGPDVEFV